MLAVSNDFQIVFGYIHNPTTESDWHTTQYFYSSAFSQTPRVWVTSALDYSNFSSTVGVSLRTISLSAITNITRSSVTVQYYGFRNILAIGV